MDRLFYCLMLPNRAVAGSRSLIYQQTVALFKSQNIKWHYETKHKSFADSFQLGSNLSKFKIASLLSSYAFSIQIMSRLMAEQEKCSPLISWFNIRNHSTMLTNLRNTKKCSRQPMFCLSTEKMFLKLFGEFRYLRVPITQETLIIWQKKIMLL